MHCTLHIVQCFGTFLFLLPSFLRNFFLIQSQGIFGRNVLAIPQNLHLFSSSIACWIVDAQMETTSSLPLAAGQYDKLLEWVAKYSVSLPGQDF